MLPTTRNELLSVQVRRAFPDVTVGIGGEVDAANVGELYEIFAELAREGAQRISLNLAGLTFMDSTGLSLLVAIHKRALASGGELVIVSPTRPVHRLFAVAGLDAFFTIRPMAAADPISGRSRPTSARHHEISRAG